MATPLAPIVCAIDDVYVEPLRTLMRSIAVAHGPDVDELRLVVLDQGLAPENTASILRDAESLGLLVEIRSIPDADPDLPIGAWYSRAIYARMTIPDVIEDEPRVLYMDVDTLVLGDLRPLLVRDLGGHPIGAARDPISPLIGHGPGMPGWKALGLPEGRAYFNSGVMLLDLARIRGSRLFERAREFLAEHPDKVHFYDQDALNYAADGDWHRIESRWNTFAMSPRGPEYVHPAEHVNPLAGLIEDEKSAAVIHFAGRKKPWQDNYPASELRDLYRHFQLSAWDAIRT
ncbi:glycosyltransferase family 8 protein [Lentzea albidocapillata]|uniref:Lipopolysaccharide biosynthesis protein, LPS:glycosyltransferase n=1 Tax=Lentzea albidocapillata TaxID=40571 RepID=A0A1W2F8X5_9PSEU|nr:glycosyltransferase family 8 protein [Lentzea albidocapillata]SMD18345.1 Lipopolysaccharide biosynthesis protein, LPS:glycosyltransferase [Lentzea albidocapillata]